MSAYQRFEPEIQEIAQLLDDLLNLLIYLFANTQADIAHRAVAMIESLLNDWPGDLESSPDPEFPPTLPGGVDATFLEDPFA